MKKQRIMKFLIQALLVFLVALVIFIGLDQLVPKAEPILQPVTSSRQKSDFKEKIHYVAIGDSLTEGIGDQTGRGGFVPIIADDLKERYQLTSIEVENYGVAGERSDQILKRIKDDKIMKNVESADFITLTVGGNDLLKVIQNNFFSLKVSSFDKPRKKYQTRVADIIKEIRKVNQTAPIYVLGIYNPFYLNFPEITDMQTVVDKWNDATKETVAESQRAYFIPVNDLLYQGLENQQGISSELSSSDEAKINQGTTSSGLQTVDNNVLYEGDKFHPNNTGYQLMASALRTELIKTQDEWAKKAK